MSHTSGTTPPSNHNSASRDATGSAFTFAPGEGDIFVSKYSPSLLLFWLKTELTVTNRRFLARKANSLLGLIPFGSNDFAQPLSNIASVGVNVKFKFRRFFGGLFLFFLAMSAFAFESLTGFLFLAFSLVTFLNTLSTAFITANNAGAVTSVEVSILEKSKMENFRQMFEQRLYADHDALRHQQSMQQQQFNANVQQHQMNELLSRMQSPPAQQPEITPLPQPDITSRPQPEIDSN